MSDLFATLKLLFRSLWTSRHVDHIHELRLETSLKMLQTAHFNAKMNALKEISKMVEESQSQSRQVKSPIPHQRLSQWMKENEVLETALGGIVSICRLLVVYMYLHVHETRTVVLPPVLCFC